MAPNDWTPRSEAYFVFPLAQGTPGKQCGLAATGVYQPSLRSPWLAAVEKDWNTFKISKQLKGGNYIPSLVVRSLDKILGQMNYITALYANIAK